MTGERLSAFGGMIPLVSSRLLPPNMAWQAVNTFLRNGEIRGLRESTILHTMTGGPFLKAYRIPDPAAPTVPLWKGFESRFAALFPNPLTNDAYDRYLWVDNNGPDTTAPLYMNSYARMQGADPDFLLGVPAPAAAPSLSVTGGSGLVTTRSYVYTYVNLFGEEGPPSPAVTVSGFLNGSWDLTDLDDHPTPTDYGIENRRIYRTVSGTTGATFYRVVEQDSSATSTYSDTNADNVVVTNPQLESNDWDPPPDVEGIVLMPNGFFAAWAGKDIFFSEPFRPWAWPASYTLSTEYRIHQCAVIDQTLVVMTESVPYTLTGTSPGNMVMSKLPVMEPCVEPNSIISNSSGIYYASNSGLMRITANGPANTTRLLIGRDEWVTQYVPKIRSAVIYDSQYIVLGENGDGFLLEPETPERGVTLLDRMDSIDNIWVDPWTSEAHLIFNNVVYLWNDSEAPFIVADWTSKDFHYQKPINVGAVSVSIDPAYNTGATASSLFSDPSAPVGGPWNDQSSIVNYNRVNGAAINAAPTWGDPPPDNPDAAVWPYWFGVVPADADFALPEGVDCMLLVYGDNALVWKQPVLDGVVYRPTSGFKTPLWRFRVKTRVPVLSIHFAENGKELRNV